MVLLVRRLLLLLLSGMNKKEAERFDDGDVFFSTKSLLKMEGYLGRKKKKEENLNGGEMQRREVVRGCIEIMYVL